MKQHYWVLSLALAAAACQPHTPATQELAATITAKAPVAAAPVRVVELSPRIPQFLVQHNLARVLQTVTDPQSGSSHIYNGFFGPGHRRIELVFTQVSRDEDRPGRYYVQGKSRYKSIITPFSGLLLLTELVEQPHYSTRELAGTDDPNAYVDPELDKETMYTATGSFALREDSTHKNSGVFRGKVALDVYLDSDQGLRLASRTRRTPTRGGEAKYEGTWTPYGAASSKRVVWVENIFAYGPQVLNNFTIGERDPDFNPKYAKLGWNTYWTNDEWWTDSYRDTARSAPLPHLAFTPPVASAHDSVPEN